MRKGKPAHEISPVALEAVGRIDALFDIERGINGMSAEERLAARQRHVRPLIEELHDWYTTQRAQMSRHNPVAKAINYMFEKEGRWEAFTRFLDDGRLCLSNNAAERALRGIATTVSYCTSSSNVRKQGLLAFHFDATRASVTRKLGHFLLFQVGRSYLVRRVRHNLLGRKHPLLDQPADTMGRNTKLFSGFGQREPFAVLLC